MTRLAIASALIVVAAMAVFWRGAGDRAPSPAGYVTAPAVIGAVRRTVSATGALRAVSTVDVSSQLSGQITRVEADFNAVVEQGQLLAELDRRGFEARVAQAVAEATIARNHVEVLLRRIEQAGSRLRGAEAQRAVFAARTDQARAAAQTAERQLARSQTLVRQGAATVTAFEDAQGAADAARAALREVEAVADAHEHEIASLAAGLREAQAEVVSAAAALPLRDAAVDLARLDLERSAIRSPIDGVVVGRAAEPGQIVAASLEAPVLFTIAGDLARMAIHANVDETDIGEIAPGQPAAFTVDAFPGRAFAADVTELRKFPQVLQGVVTYTVVLRTGNPDGRLLPGMTSTVRIVVEEVSPVLTVPLAALRFAPDEGGPAGDAVHVVAADGSARVVAVDLGADDRSVVAVIGGDLAEGDAVILDRARAPAPRRLFGIRF